MEELLGTKDGGNFCLEAALAAGDTQQVPRALVGAQQRHPLLSVYLLCPLPSPMNNATPRRDINIKLVHAAFCSSFMYAVVV